MEEEVRKNSQENSSANGSIWSKWYMIVIYVAIIGVLVFLIATMDFSSNADVGPNDTLKSDQNDNSTNKSEQGNYREIKKLFDDSLDPNETLEMNSSRLLPGNGSLGGNFSVDFESSVSLDFQGFLGSSRKDFSKGQASWSMFRNEFKSEGAEYKTYVYKFESVKDARKYYKQGKRNMDLAYEYDNSWNLGKDCFGMHKEVSIPDSRTQDSKGYAYNKSLGVCIKNNYVFRVASKGVDENHYQNAEKLMNAMIGKFPY